MAEIDLCSIILCKDNQKAHVYSENYIILYAHYMLKQDLYVHYMLKQDLYVHYMYIIC